MASIEEEQRLFSLIAQGDEEARRRVIEGNLGFVHFIAREYAHDPDQLDDYVQEGVLGLMRALETFDPEKGWKFISYAVHPIRWRIWAAHYNYFQTVRCPLSTRRSEDEMEALALDQRHLTKAERLHFMTKRVLKKKHTYVHINKAVSEGGDDTLEWVMADTTTAPPDHAVQQREIVELIRGVVDRLPPRQRDVIVQCYGLDGEEPKRLEDVSKSIGLTRKRVRHIKENSLQRMRVFLMNNHLTDFDF